MTVTASCRRAPRSARGQTRPKARASPAGKTPPRSHTMALGGECRTTVLPLHTAGSTEMRSPIWSRSHSTHHVDARIPLARHRRPPQPHPRPGAVADGRIHVVVEVVVERTRSLDRGQNQGAAGRGLGSPKHAKTSNSRWRSTFRSASARLLAREDAACTIQASCWAALVMRCDL